jgi:ATP-binding cassette subfamily F protein 3
VLSQGNLLLLDEPTNHLDIPAREALEDALESYTGTLVFASHDRRLISRIATRLWVIEDGTIVSFEGTLEEYDAARAPAKPQKRPVEAPKPRPAMSKNRERDLQDRIDALETSIEAVETLIDDLGKRINAASGRGDATAVRDLGVEYEEARAELERLVEAWTQLAG